MGHLVCVVRCWLKCHFVARRMDLLSSGCSSGRHELLFLLTQKPATTRLSHTILILTAGMREL